MKRMPSIAWLALMLVALLSPVAMGAAGAATPQQPARLDVKAQPQPDGTVTLAARLTDTAGQPLTIQTVQFHVQTDFFFERPVLLGSGVTASDGTVGLTVRPTWTGSHRFQAGWAGDDRYGPTAGAALAEITTASPVYTPPPPDLLPIRQGMAIASAAVLLGVWVTIMAVMIRVGIGLARGPVAVPAGATVLEESTAD